MWPTGDELEMDLQLEKAAHLIFYWVLWSCKGIPLLRLDRHWHSAFNQAERAVNPDGALVSEPTSVVMPNATMFS